MTKAISAGSEVDSWCTKCKLDLNHRVIAMNGIKIVRVECLTCRGHHAFRRPKSAAPLPKKRAAKKTGTKTTRAKTTRSKSVSSIKQRWEQAVLGRTDSEFVRYTIAQTFKAKQLVRHKKFGDGVISELLDDGKVMVLFEAGEKMLVHGRV